MILLLGARYGAEQPSGLSATHEEYREAKDRCDVLVFIQAGTQREPDQDRFIRETQDWEAGRYTESFSTPAGLRDSVIRAVHRLELSRSTGFPDQDEMLARAESLTPTEEAGRDVQVSLIVVGGPRQSILRPSQPEDEGLRKILQREANYGDLAVFNPAAAQRADLPTGPSAAGSRKASPCSTPVAMGPK